VSHFYIALDYVLSC